MSSPKEASLTESRRRLLTLAAAINLILGVGVATAQTVILRNAPPGSAVEVLLNGAEAGSAQIDATGIATIAVNLSKDPTKTETDAQIFVDVCDKARRVLIAERGVLPAAPERGCTRTDMGGWFLVRRVSTLLIDVGGPTPTLLLRQGKVSLDPSTTWSASPTGLVLFGGGAYTKVRDARLLACGNVPTCSGNDSGFGYTAGVAYWVTPFLAAEATWIKPADVKAEGTAGNFRFNSTFDADVFTIAGKVGIPLGAVRPFGQVGANYTRATLSTTQILTDVTEGATQTNWLRTGGWGWQFGGGLEAWVKPAFAIYGEAGYAFIKGTPLDDEDGLLDDRLTYILFGARVRIGW